MQEPTETSDVLPGMEEYVPAPPEYGGLLSEPKGSPVFAEYKSAEAGVAALDNSWKRRDAIELAQRAMGTVTDINVLLSAAEAVLAWTEKKGEAK